MSLRLAPLIPAGLCLLFATAIPSTPSVGQSSPVFSVDATGFVPPTPSSFHGGTSRSPDGHTLGMNNLYLTLDGQPWLPVMGEFHYTRVPESMWEEEILKMKASGVSIIATYVIWIHHEEIEGQFDWTGVRNLRHFVELCAKHGMYVYPRVGPWAHGEVRNGGFPDWLLQKTQNTRENDTVYLSYVQKYYAEVGQQLKGLLWKDGGPVIGLQLENEYARRGPRAGEAHILELKKMAVESGIDVPLYSVTGWDNAVVPQGETIAVFGGYPDAPWDASLIDLPPAEVYTFRLNSRVSGNMGAIGISKSAASSMQYDFPFITAEMGGGVQDTYHRRPIIKPDDVAAMVPVMLGSGVNLYGSYMFQGGENPDGKLTTLQESQATHYPTDVPVKSYDFQAPLGEFGEEREVFRKLKIFNYFMQSFGPMLAPMEPHAPNILPSNPQDLSVARWMVRSQGESGFLFFNNYVRGGTMPNRNGFQAHVTLPHGNLDLPGRPVDIPSGVYGIWPFNLRMGQAVLRYATAQPFTRLISGKKTTYYFVATAGVPPEFVFHPGTEVRVLGAKIKVVKDQGMSIVRNIQPSLGPAFTLLQSDGSQVEVVLLNQQQAENSWKITEGGQERLLITDAQMYADEHHVFMQQDSRSQFAFEISPPPSRKLTATTRLTETAAPFVSRYTASLPAVHPVLRLEQTAKPGEVPPARIGPPATWRNGVAVAPEDTDFMRAAKWNITVPPGDWTGVNDLFLEIKYRGDVGRLASGGKLLTDNFYNGEPWRVGLSRFRGQVAKYGLELQVLPLRRDAPIFLEEPFRVAPAPGQLMELNGISVVPQYRLTLNVP